MNCLTQV